MRGIAAGGERSGAPPLPRNVLILRRPAAPHKAYSKYLGAAGHALSHFNIVPDNGMESQVTWLMISMPLGSARSDKNPPSRWKNPGQGILRVHCQSV